MNDAINIDKSQHIGLKVAGIALIVIGVALLAIPFVPSTPFVIAGMFLIGEESVHWTMDRLSEERKERVKDFLHRKEETIEGYLKKLPEAVKNRARGMINAAKRRK